jgi:uncharacterized damage-inducible protein DinB
VRSAEGRSNDKGKSNNNRNCNSKNSSNCKGKGHMAIYHLSATVGTRSSGQSAVAKDAYISRTGKYAKGKQELAHVESGNMPAWAKENTALYWQAADLYERANGRLFQQVEIALPRELTEDQQIALAVSFAKELAQTPDGALPFTVAVHRGKGENPHAHIVLSERVNDGIARASETWFKRAAVVGKQTPEQGGAKKTAAFQGKQWIDELRQQWAERANLFLAQLGREERIDHRSHAERGIEAMPTIHEGPNVRAMARADRFKGDRAATNDEIRAANVEMVKVRTEEEFVRKNLAAQLAAMLLQMLAEIRAQIARIGDLKRKKDKQDAERAAVLVWTGENTQASLFDFAPEFPPPAAVEPVLTPPSKVERPVVIETCQQDARPPALTPLPKPEPPSPMEMAQANILQAMEEMSAATQQQLRSHPLTRRIPKELFAAAELSLVKAGKLVMDCEIVVAASAFGKPEVNDYVDELLAEKEAAQVRASVEWYVKNIQQNPLEFFEYQRNPFLLEFHASQRADYAALAEPLKLHSKVLADHLAGKNYERMKAKRPDLPDGQLQYAARYGRWPVKKKARSQEIER